MSDEKIDLAEVEAITRRWYGMTHPVLALVRAVRAARDLAHKGYHPRRWPDFVAALAPFTDSAEVRSDA